VNGSTLFLVVATNAGVALAIAAFVKGGLIALAKTIASMKSEQAKVRVILANQENRITELVKKVSVLHMVVVKGHQPRIQDLEFKTKDQGPKAY
jgi:ribosomal protein L30E